MSKIFLAEDNGGGLAIGNADLGWFDVTSVQQESSFIEDASAMANGDTSDWTVEHYDHDESFDGNVVAAFDNGNVEVLGNLGTAAKIYLRQ